MESKAITLEQKAALEKIKLTLNPFNLNKVLNEEIEVLLSSSKISPLSYRVLVASSCEEIRLAPKTPRILGPACAGTWLLMVADGPGVPAQKFAL